MRIMDDRSILDGELVREFTRRQSHVPKSSWALGWDTPTAPSSSGAIFLPNLSDTWVTLGRLFGLIQSKSWRWCCSQIVCIPAEETKPFARSDR